LITLHDQIYGRRNKTPERNTLITVAKVFVAGGWGEKSE
jgi:hypothetical protein